VGVAQRDRAGLFLEQVQLEPVEHDPVRHPHRGPDSGQRQLRLQPGRLPARLDRPRAERRFLGRLVPRPQVHRVRRRGDADDPRRHDQRQAGLCARAAATVRRHRLRRVLNCEFEPRAAALRRSERRLYACLRRQYR
jgi:hypothetical protein